MKAIISLVTIAVSSIVIINTMYSQPLPDNFRIGSHTVSEWKDILDTTWGSGLPQEDKLTIFETYWETVNNRYAGFVNNPVNWDSIHDIFRTEIEKGVSRGRFAGIMSSMSLELMEGHNSIVDYEVSTTEPKPGVPILIHEFYGSEVLDDQGHFGAALTPLDDDASFVFRVVPDHPLGLEIGDLVLGYDHIPWVTLYKQLLRLNFPVTNNPYPRSGPRNVMLMQNGGSNESRDHHWKRSVGLNWHLFDTIDIVKYRTKDTIHLPTRLLEGYDYHISGNEQLPVDGVEMPGSIFHEGYDLGIPPLLYGIIENTNIGYIYVWTWSSKGLSDMFLSAINDLIQKNVTGLIFDYRRNVGGSLGASVPGYNRMFNFDVNTLGNSNRSHFERHLDLHPCTVSGHYCKAPIPGITGDTFLFDRPIAVLTGPSCFSAGEFNGYLLKSHPMSRFFGKGTNGSMTSFNGFYSNSSKQFDHCFLKFDLGYPDWQMTVTSHNLHEKQGEEFHYLSHIGLDVDEKVWLTPEDAIKGVDPVAGRAIEWIQNLSHAHNIGVVYPFNEPGKDTIVITALVENPNNNGISVSAHILFNENTVVDSIPLFDDGRHFDENPGDGLWGAILYVPNGDTSYTATIKTEDHTTGTLRILPDVVQFKPKDLIAITSLNNNFINQLNPTMTIYPNPTDGFLQLDIQNSDPERCDIEIFNATGIVVYRRTGTQNLIDLSGYPDGIYFIKVEVGKEILIQKIIIK